MRAMQVKSVNESGGLMDALASRLRSEFHDWCGVVSIDELSTNSRLSHLIEIVDRMSVGNLVAVDVAFDRLFRSVSKQERHTNYRLKRRMRKIRHTLRLLRQFHRPDKRVLGPISHILDELNDRESYFSSALSRGSVEQVFERPRYGRC